ncbi:hypothetical protein Tco_0528159 [Tanacetum coccineum]
MPLRNIRDDIRQKFMIDVSLGQCWRVKQLALFDHEGGLIEHYGILFTYRQDYRLNPGSTGRLDVMSLLMGPATFKRIPTHGQGCLEMEGDVQLLRMIRLYIMHRIVAMNKLAFSLEDRITPSIRKRLEILKKKQREWIVYPSGFQELEVRKGDQSYGVNLQHKKRTNDVQLLPSLIRTMPGIP